MWSSDLLVIPTASNSFGVNFVKLLFVQEGQGKPVQLLSASLEMIIYDNTMTLECSRPGLLQEASTTEVTCINGVSCGAQNGKPRNGYLPSSGGFGKHF